MATPPPRPRSPPVTRAMRARAAASSDRFPPDVLFNVLLRLPARDLCRLRAVCRSWRALTSGDPLFAAAHADAHLGPLFLAKFLGDESSICVVDLSGNVLKRVANAACHYLLCTSLNLVCLASDRNRCRVLDPATGAVQVLPETPAEEHANRVNLRDPYTSFAFGRVAATGEHKVLRMFNRPCFGKGYQQLFEVFTINGGDGDEARWRGRQGPGLFIDKCSGVVVDGVAYFLTSRVYDHSGSGIRADYVLSFDLGTEEWRRDLRGPISSSDAGDGIAQYYTRRDLSLAELKGSLVLADHGYPRAMKLWFLSDFGNGLWVKEYHILTLSINSRMVGEYYLKPLLVLDDGRLVIYLASAAGLLFICDPGTNTFAEVDIRGLDSVGVYTGNLLRFGDADMM